MTEPVLTSKSGALWVFPDGPNHEGFYLGCIDAGDIAIPLGDITLTQCFNPSGCGWDTLGKKKGPPGAITTTFTSLTTSQRNVLEKLHAKCGCGFGAVLLQRDGGRADDFSNWVRAVVLDNCRMTQRGKGGIVHHVNQDDSTQSFNIASWPPLIDVADVQQVIVSNTSPRRFNDVAMLKTGTGIYPVKYGLAVTEASAPAKGLIYYTTDGGQTWTATAAQPYAVDYDIRACAILDMGGGDYRLIVVQEPKAGTQGQVAYSDDWGATWVLVNIGGAAAGHGATFHSLFALDRFHIWLGETHGYIYFSNDAGATWTAQEAGVIAATPYYGLKVLSDGLTGYAVTAAGIVAKTVDGVHWNACMTAVTGAPTLNAVHVLDEDKLWVGDTVHALWYSEDGGDSWAAGSVLDDQINGIHFINDWVGFICTAASVYRTIDGGLSWEAQANPGGLENQSIYAGSENYCLAVGDNGTGDISIYEE